MNTTLDANGTIPAPLDVAMTTMAGGLLAGAVGANAQGAATAAENETLNNHLNHIPPKPMTLSQAEQYQQAAATGDGSTQDKLAALSAQNDQNLAQACANGPSAGCQVQIQAAQAGGNVVTMKPLGNGQYFTYANPLLGMTGPENFPFSALNPNAPTVTALPDSYQSVYGNSFDGQVATSTYQGLSIAAPVLTGSVLGTIPGLPIFSSEGLLGSSTWASPVGTGLIGAGINAGSQYLQTGKVNPVDVVTSFGTSMAGSYGGLPWNMGVNEHPGAEGYPFGYASGAARANGQKSD